MKDIVGELQNMAGDPDTRAIDRMMAEAAAAEITRLRAALAAETERCADIADDAEIGANGHSEWEDGWCSACQRIAAAIRETDNG